MLDDEDFLMEDEEDIDYNILCNDTLENFPFIEDDVDALTDYELFSRGFGYLDEKKADKSEIPSLDNYYNKDEVDDLLDEKADKSEIPSLDNYYDKDEVDDLLDDKADISDIPDVSNFITKDVNDLTYYTKTSNLSTVATTGDYDDLLDKPTIPDVSNFITKDVNDLTYYTKTSDLSTVATTGDYDDLLDKPTIPDVSNFITKDVNDLTYYTSTTALNTLLANKENVIETGSNTNGSYVKFDNGVLICRTTISINTATNIAYGSMFESPILSLGNTPYNFVGDYQISVTETRGPGVMLEGTSGKTSSSYGYFYIISAVTRNAQDFTFDILAIGNWK